MKWCLLIYWAWHLSALYISDNCELSVFQSELVRHYNYLSISFILLAVLTKIHENDERYDKYIFYIIGSLGARAVVFHGQLILGEHRHDTLVIYVFVFIICIIFENPFMNWLNRSYNRN